VATRSPRVLLGRAGEREMFDRLLRNVRGGQSGVLVIRGEAGVGKTALLQDVAGEASAFRVTQVTGIEAEVELPFATLHLLCAPLLTALDGLPEPQRDALRVALGLSSGDPPDRFLVALAVLSLLSAVAEEQPLLCVVDDAQWLDRASGPVLAFVARRLLAESVALVFAVREPSGRRELDGLPELLLGGLGEEDARALLATAVPGRLDDRVRDRIVAETRGNPLALLELSRDRSAPQLAGGFDLPATADLPSRIEDHYLGRVRALPGATQRLLLLAAAESRGDAAVVWRAADTLGIGAGDLAPAEDAALLEIGADVRFRHPLVRSASYRTGSPEDRRRVHAALAEATDPDVDADCRAWHRALAAAGPSEDVAADLERSAGRAQRRGGLAAAAAFLERATVLTPELATRARRALAAAEAEHVAGASAAALALAAQAEAGPLDQLQRARVQLVRGRAAFTSSHGADAPRLLLAAAREREPLDAGQARDAYLDALTAALFAGRLGGDTGAVEVAHAVRAAPPHSGRPQDLLLDGYAVVITDGYAAGAALLKQAVYVFRTADMSRRDAIRWLWLAGHAAHVLWDDESWEELSDRHVALARQAGALAMLPLALAARVAVHLTAGELASAAALTDEIVAILVATDSNPPTYSTVGLAGFRGREAEAEPLIDEVRARVAPRREGIGLTILEHAEAVLYIGLGRYQEACAAAQRGAADPPELGYSTAALVQLVEAAVRSDQPALADDALQQLARSTRASGTDWALGTEARSRALVADDGGAEALYQEAIERLARTRARPDCARAHLVYGEWLRRQGRRVDAREQLRTAHRLFTDMGMEAFAERSRRELTATGETVRKRKAETRDDLTPQEEQIARLARDGLSNADIGAQLFLSPRTVEWHLRKVFGKLEISSRIGLHDALPASDRQVAPA
jgi:DNA-binding CsgD family transcriptional regulator